MTIHSASTVSGRDIPWLIEDRANQWPDRICIEWEPFAGERKAITYGNLWLESLSIAAALQEQGLKSGESILIHMDNSPEAIMTWIASAIVGSVAVTTNTAAIGADLEYFVKHSGAAFAVSDAAYGPLLERLPKLSTIWLNGDQFEVRGRFRRFDELQSGQVSPHRRRNPAHPLSIQFTSGSTSRPKAVLWTHGNALWGAHVSALHQQLAADDVYLCCLPFFHTNAQTYVVLPTLWAGGKVVLQPRFSASRFWPVSLRHGCTRASLVPFCMRALWDLPVPPEHQFKTWGLGVAHPEAAERFGVQILGWWGMTETISQCIVSDQATRHACMSMGRASPAYEVELRDTNGVPVKPGEIGQIYVRGQRGVALFKEYFHDGVATSQAFTDDGWFATGDLAHQDLGGDFFFDSRIGDVIKCAGETVSPQEVEAVLMRTAGIKEAAVVGCPDTLYGEIPVAFVIGDLSDSTLPDRALEVCQTALAPFKVPRSVSVVTDLPRAALNKVAKGQLRELAIRQRMGMT